MLSKEKLSHDDWLSYFDYIFPLHLSIERQQLEGAMFSQAVCPEKTSSPNKRVVTMSLTVARHNQATKLIIRTTSVRITVYAFTTPDNTYTLYTAAYVE